MLIETRFLGIIQFSYFSISTLVSLLNWPTWLNVLEIQQYFYPAVNCLALINQFSYGNKNSAPIMLVLEHTFVSFHLSWSVSSNMKYEMDVNSHPKQNCHWSVKSTVEETKIIDIIFFYIYSKVSLAIWTSSNFYPFPFVLLLESRRKPSFSLLQ